MTSTERKKTVLITGCSGGIGEALAREFHAKSKYAHRRRGIAAPDMSSADFHVIATARRPESIRHLAEQGMSTVVLDVTNEESIATAKVKVERITGGKLDILVNNAGVTTLQPLLDTTHSSLTHLFTTNIFAPVLTTSAFAALLSSSNSSSTASGLVINISSASSAVAFPFRGLYAMTKAALNAYSRSLAIEVSPFSIRVMTVVTGFVGPTDLSSRASAVAELPAESWYAALVGGGGTLRRGNPGRMMDKGEYARLVVAEVLKWEGWGWGGWRVGGMRSWLWVGTTAPTIWWGSWLGEAFMDWVVRRIAGWGEVEATLRKKDKGV